MKSESPGMFDPEGTSGECNIHARSTLIILSSASAKGRAGSRYDLEREDGKVHICMSNQSYKGGNNWCGILTTVVKSVTVACSFTPCAFG